jgi:hypothetical protein
MMARISPRLCLLPLLTLVGCQAVPSWPGAGVSFRLEQAVTPSDLTGPPAVPVAVAGGAPAIAATAAPTPPPADGDTGSSRGASFSGWVRDELKQPVAGARVLLADGRAAESAADGRFIVAGAQPAGAVVVSAAGHVASLVWEARGIDTFHLRRTRRATPAFDQQQVFVTGRVIWPSDDHLGGVAYYQDSLDSVANPVRLEADGSFSIAVTSRAPGTALATVLVLAGNAAGETLVGLTRPFAPFAGESAGDVVVGVADQPIDFAVTDVPAGLDVHRSRLEFLQDGVTPVTFAGPEAVAGIVKAPAASALPGRMRLVVEAATASRDASAMVVVPAEGGTVRAKFLGVPAFEWDLATRHVTWPAVPEATGYHLEAVSYAGSAAMFEGWSLMPAAMRVPEGAWPAPAGGDLVLRALDATAIGTRHVAGMAPRRLRVAPWADEPRYRVSSRRQAL